MEGGILPIKEMEAQSSLRKHGERPRSQVRVYECVIHGVGVEYV